ncbi:hypothetical protein SCUCBS95973_000764 [Sporothrix curviconia]|uniref:Mitochondrial thiamine pyrophosphate carrier 1 n=1 Tax=Sporothrix curviconia TaxID=1260050 RepID=A0ABP0AT01_9PEZI
MTAGDNTAPPGASSEGASMPSTSVTPAAASVPASAPASPTDAQATSTVAVAELRAIEFSTKCQRDKRIEDLWRRLDPQGDRELDLKGLKKGLRRIDHPMKNADDMLREIIDIVDVNGDGKIQFEEFRVFVEAAERQLLLLFRTIDRNHDGRLNKDELRDAFQKTGLAVPVRRLNGFFDEIDMNRDGYITFDEWRDFLLFIPTKGSDSPLEAAFSYYSSAVVLNAEGDSMVSDETLEGLGTTGNLLQALFGSILKLAQPTVSVARPGEREEGQQTPQITIAIPDGETEQQDTLPPPHRKRRRVHPSNHTAPSEPIPPVPSSPAPPSPPPPPLPPDADADAKEEEGAKGAKRRKGINVAVAPSETKAKEASLSSAAAGTSTKTGTDAMAGGGEGGEGGKKAANAVPPATAAATIASTTTDDVDDAPVAGRGAEYEVYEDLDDVDELDEALDERAVATAAAATAANGTKLQKALTRTKKKAKYSKLTQYVPHPGYFLAGALAGGISRTATAPFDRLKVYLLVNTQSKGAGASAAAEATKAAVGSVASGKSVPNNLRRTGRPIRDAMVNLYRAGGLRTFFAGNGLNVVKIMPETAIKFGSYEAAKRTFAALEGHGDPTHIRPSSKFVAGGVAGMIAQFCVYPLDTLKFRLQCETVQGGPTGNALLLQTAKRMYATGGLAAAYRGVTMGLIGMFPYSAIDMGTFELVKTTFMRYKARYYGIHEEDAAPGNVVTGIIGATSGAFGATVVYPLNVLRTRLQTQGTVMHPPTYTGIWDVATRTVANEGVRGLYKGLTPNLLKVAPALSITWVVYENSKKALGLP